MDLLGGLGFFSTFFSADLPSTTRPLSTSCVCTRRPSNTAEKCREALSEECREALSSRPPSPVCDADVSSPVWTADVSAPVSAAASPCPA
jgi:hypothetical protein